MHNSSREEIEAVLAKEVAVILGVDAGTIDAAAPLHTLGIDSLSFVEILVFIEKSFKVKLMESGLTRQDFQTIRSLAECISRMD